MCFGFCLADMATSLGQVLRCPIRDIANAEKVKRECIERNPTKLD